MSHEQVVFRAALARTILALYGLTLLPTLYPGMRALWPVFAGYLVIVAILQVMIRQNIGGNVRAFAGGLVDLAILTLLVHRAGSNGTVLVSLYLFAGTMNALVTESRVAMALAVCGSVTYTMLAVAESLHWIPYGPDAPSWAGHAAPPLHNALVASAMVAIMVLFSTSLVVHLVKLVRQRETALETANVQLEEISQHDPLTQLYNRRYLFQRMQDEIARIAVEGRSLSVLMIDLDGFKHVNDESGHLRGDALLKEIASALVKNCRESDVAARYGGDEFVILLPGTAAERATQVAERIAQAIRDVGLRFDGKRPVTGSVGLAEAMRDEEVASLLRRADQNAYRAKQSGGNRVAA